MVLIKDDDKEMCNNGICSLCDNKNAVVYWSGAMGLALCKECMEHIIPCLIGDYIFGEVYGTHRAISIVKGNLGEVGIIIERFSSKIYKNITMHIDVKLRREFDKRQCIEHEARNLSCCDNWFKEEANFKHCPECGKKYKK